jgi:uncharacterized membrane protein YGL010W
MTTINSLLSEYGESHQNHTNKMVHWICVPLIFFSLVGLIWSIPSESLRQLTGLESPYVNWATLLLLLVMIYYVMLSVTLALGMAVFGALCLWIAHQLDMSASWPLWIICIVIFVVAWIGQFYGHKIEGKKPSFLKDVQFLLIGPAWLMHFIYKKLGIPY